MRWLRFAPGKNHGEGSAGGGVKMYGGHASRLANSSKGKGRLTSIRSSDAAPMHDATPPLPSGESGVMRSRLSSSEMPWSVAARMRCMGECWHVARPYRGGSLIAVDNRGAEGERLENDGPKSHRIDARRSLTINLATSPGAPSRNGQYNRAIARRPGPHSGGPGRCTTLSG